MTNVNTSPDAFVDNMTIRERVIVDLAAALLNLDGMRRNPEELANDAEEYADALLAKMGRKA